MSIARNADAIVQIAYLQIELLFSLSFPNIPLPVDLTEHEIHGADDGDSIGQQVAAGNLVET